MKSFAREHKFGIVFALLAIAAFLLRDQLPDFDIEKILEDLSGSLGDWTYLLVGGLAFLETGAFVGLVAPGEFTVILGGAVAGQGDISLPAIIAIAWFSAWAGDSVSFLLGQKLGRGFLRRHGRRVGITNDRLTQVERYFSRHGGKTILIGRFIGLVRALAPFIAGSSAMRYRAFVPYSILGTGLWAGGLILVGYFASQSLDKVAEIVGRGFLLFGIVVGVIVGIVAAIRHLRVAANRERIVEAIEHRPLFRPGLEVARRLRPQTRFLWRRLTPGHLGLELTTLIAVLAVALYVLIAYTAIVSGDPGPTPGDVTAHEAAQDIQEGWLTDIANAVTKLGSAWVILPLTAISTMVLALRRRWAEAVVLVLAVTITFDAVHIFKDSIDRPRPDGADAPGFAFPSGHAAHAALYAWLGVTLALRVPLGLTRRTALILTGVAVATVVGLTRVYLGVHYLSDVTAGWALGVSAFALVGAVALVLSHIRQNGSPDERPARHNP